MIHNMRNEKLSLKVPSSREASVLPTVLIVVVKVAYSVSF
jgi:hypothetical protein